MVCGRTHQCLKVKGIPEGRLLRAAALILVLAGAAGSLVLMLRAGQHTPRLLLVAFIFWILSPFVVLAWATVVSKRWSAAIRATLYGMTLVLTLGSLAAYGDVVAVAPRGSSRGFVFVAVPGAAWLLIAATVAIATVVFRRRSRRSDGAGSDRP